jgi:hypothetical protein
MIELKRIIFAENTGLRALHEVCADPAVDVKIEMSRTGHDITSPRYFFRVGTWQQLTVTVSLDQPYSAGDTYKDLIKRLEESKNPAAAPAPAEAEKPKTSVPKPVRL